MKKVFIALVALTLALVLLCFAACDKYAGALQDINTLLKKDYSSVTLNVTTTTKGVTLEGIYVLTFDGDKTNVEFSYQKLNELTMDGGESFVSTVTGKAVVQNGKIVSGDETLDLPKEYDFNGLSFKQAFFANYTVTGSKFDADVTNAKGFVNGDLVCSDMHVTVLYSKTAISKIALTYLSEKGSEVSIT